MRISDWSSDVCSSDLAEEAVEQARGQLAALIGASPREVIFTSGATESNNLAIKGAARFHRARRPHVVTLTSEHKCVLESVRQLEREGHPVDEIGRASCRERVCQYV